MTDSSMAEVLFEGTIDSCERYFALLCYLTGWLLFLPKTAMCVPEISFSVYVLKENNTRAEDNYIESSSRMRNSTI